MTRPGSSETEGTSAAPGRHYLALDGLRGIAIIGVMALHYLGHAPSLPNPLGRWLTELAIDGQYGVDLFFVLSGFLITGILLATRDSPTYFRAFYARRVLRIFPLYYAALLLLLVIIPAVAPAALSTPRDGRMSPLWFWTYLANWPIAVRGWQVVSPAVGHFWTLAIEEQFYLLWPAVVFLVPKERLLRVCGMLLAIGVLLRYALLHRWPTLVVPDAATFTRCDGLVLGAMLAIWWQSPALVQWRRWPAPLLFGSLAVLLLIRVSRGSLELTDRVMLMVGLTAVALVFTSAVAMALLRESERGSAGWLAASPLRFMGRYSYAIYVWHPPIQLILASAGFTVPMLLSRWHSILAVEAGYVAVNGGATIAMSLLSWHLLERPMLRLKARFPYFAASANAGTRTRMP
jgi:peptidoglycan/LPS O-acetylase OafA/YrhL